MTSDPRHPSAPVETAAATAAPPPDSGADSVGFDRHDHGLCIAGAMASAEARCAEEGLKFTPVRRRVLEILLREHKAVGAYDVLEVLRREGLGSQPPVAYRALDFLVSHGFAHRIEKLNAFSACVAPDAHHLPIFLICRGCRSVAETLLEPGATGPLAAAADTTGFTIERAVIEAEGLCPSCRAATAQGRGA